MIEFHETLDLVLKKFERTSRLFGVLILKESWMTLGVVFNNLKILKSSKCFVFERIFEKPGVGFLKKKLKNLVGSWCFVNFKKSQENPVFCF